MLLSVFLKCHHEQTNCAGAFDLVFARLRSFPGLPLLGYLQIPMIGTVCKHWPVRYHKGDTREV